MTVEHLGAGYIRLSKEHGDTNLSLEGMKRDLHRRAAEAGIELIDIYVDDGLSGAIRNRPEFNKWLDTARNQQVGNLMAWVGDRLTREGANVAALVLDVIEGKDPVTGAVVSKPVRFLDCHGLDSRNEQAFRIMFLIAAEQARSERQAIQRRNLATQRRLREALRYRGGAVPYGYQVVELEGGGKGLAIEPQEADFITHAVALILQGQSVYSVVERLNSLGSRPHRAEAWSTSSLLAVLRGDAVLGRMRHKGALLRGDDGMPATPWEPILTEEEVERVRGALDERSRPRTMPPSLRAARLLSGHVVCGTCGDRLVVNRITRGGKVLTRYLCNGRSMGRGCTRPVCVSADRLDPHIEGEVLRLFGRMQTTERVRTSRSNVGVAEVEAALKDLSVALLEDDQDEEVVMSQIKGLKARRAELLAAPTEAQEEVRDTGRTVAEEWTGDLQMQRTVLDYLLDGKIKVAPAEGRHVVGKPDLDRLDIPWNEAYLSWAALVG